MSFFQSEQVQENLEDIFQTYHEIASVTSQLSTMDRETRLDHIDRCKGLVDKQKTFFL